MSILNETQTEIEKRLLEIEKGLPPQYVLSLLCRNIENDNAHILLTKDNPDQIIKTVEKLKQDGEKAG